MLKMNLQANEFPKVIMHTKKKYTEYAPVAYQRQHPLSIMPPPTISLVSFEAYVNDDNSVILVWETAYETNKAGFNVYRSMKRDGTYKMINEEPITTLGNGMFRANYCLKDNPASGKYYYLLEDIDSNGLCTLHGPLEVIVKSGNGKATRRLFWEFDEKL